MSRICQVDYVVMNLTGNKYTNVNQFFILIIIEVVTFLNLTPNERMHTKECSNVVSRYSERWIHICINLNFSLVWCTYEKNLH